MKVGSQCFSTVNFILGCCWFRNNKKFVSIRFTVKKTNDIIHVPMVQNLFTFFTWLFMIPHKKISKNRAQWWLHCYAIYLTIKFTFKHEICTSSSNWKSFSRSVLEILKPVFFSKVNQHWYLLFQLIEC